MPKMCLEINKVLMQNIIMKNSILEIFNIDNIKYKTFAHCLFGFMFLLNIFSLFFPLGDSDFTGYFDWYERFMSAAQENNVALVNEMMTNVPLTKGNLIFLAFTVIIAFITFMGAMLYCAIYIKSFREQIGKTSLPVGKLIGRFVLFSIFFAIISVPSSILVLSLFFIFIIIFPWVILYPACYLSGDYGLFGSFSQMVKKAKGYYLINSKNVLVIFIATVLTNYVAQLIGGISLVAGVVIQVFFEVLMYLSFGRYIAMTYCRVTDVKKQPEVIDKQEDVASNS